MIAAKSIVTDILAGLRLDGNNDLWHRNIKFLLSETDSIDFISQDVSPLMRTVAVEV